jgi:hypothetical protein
MMILVTAPGWEIRDRCPALISVTWAWARLDMNSCSAGGITWSAVPISDQDGIVCQAGTPEGSEPALSAMGRSVAARTAASLAGRPLAKHWANPGSAGQRLPSDTRRSLPPELPSGGEGEVEAGEVA